MAKDLSPADQVKFAKMGHATLSDKFGGSYVVTKKKANEDTRKPVHSMAKKAAELISSLVAPKP